MAETTNIEWADSTFNPWIGCTKVSPGCDNCYAEHLMDHRMHKVVWGIGNERKRTSVQNWNLPLKWEREADAFMRSANRRRRVFCASLSDVFDNAVPPEWRAELFALIATTPRLDWMLLTKRIGNAASMLSAPGMPKDMLPNVWLGATVVNQEEADRDIQKLLEVPAVIHFLSIEPMLGPVEFSKVPGFAVTPSRFWVIVGGESGPGARPMEPEWVRRLRDQCETGGIQFTFKQWGAWIKPESWLPMKLVGKRAAGRLLDGRTWNGAPGGID